jgi:pyrroloquinoline quinone (PQQ) biosynthesis protein C
VREETMSEVLAPKDFIRDLVARIAARRTFCGHPLLLELADGKLSREQLKLFAVQFFLQVREFPRAVSAMHANCPFPKERMELAESIYEEETGGSPVATCPIRSSSFASARPLACHAPRWSRAGL